MNSAIYFISTGRCGTQWFTKSMAEQYGDLAEVTHEPSCSLFPAKKYLRCHDKFDELQLQPEVSGYLQHIKEVLQDKIYIETGWPSYPALPMINKFLDGRMKIVHLVRNPVHAAISHATLNIYNVADHWLQGHMIDPFDDGVVQKKLQGEWDAFSMYEKCLFMWTEINLYGLEMKRHYPDIPYMLVKYEDIFTTPRPGALEEIVNFTGLPFRDSFKNLLDVKVDLHKTKSDPQDWSQIFKYPETLALAKELGYDIQDVDVRKINSRYYTKTTEKVAKKLKEFRRRIKKLLLPG